ncbi:radical SAM protein [Desnuesiella massiliensis]|uniref:radical SAM protein n=1 Tax=Desnuesiella massiliensis TaxID=1650662 RepID=UPI0006E1D866|nr:radical SAM protein [Desnuesiella massiliensis]
MHSKLVNNFNNNLINNRIPIRTSIQLTHNCNFKCIHCYQTPIKNQFKELSTQEWFKIIDILKENGCIYLVFTGGEVFTRKDFLDIYTYAYNKNFKITIVSNGSLITHKIIDTLSKSKPESMAITLYGSNNKTYEDFTKVKNGFNLVSSSILELKKHNINIRIQAIANTINKTDIQSMRNFAKENEIHFHIFGKIRCYVDGNSCPKNLQLSPKELINVQSEEEHNAYRNLLKNPSITWNNGIKKCNAGLTNAYINPEGYLYLCNLNDGNKFSLLNYSFEYCWSKILKERKSQIEIRTYCSNCTNKGFCGLCAPVFKNEYGDISIPPKNECYFANETRKILLEG